MICVLAILAALACPQAEEPKSTPPTVWELLQKKYDADQNGEITLKEHGRGEKAFANLDRDGNGLLTKADTESSRRRAGRQGRRQGGNDRARSGGKAAPVKPPVVGQRAPDFELQLLVHITKADEANITGGEAKGEGGKAKAKKNKPKMVELSSFTGEKPVALIFGSYT